MKQLLRLGPQYLFFSLLTLHSAIAFSLPLVPYGNDSAWYYMNVVFVETGQYIHESSYPFSEPSQLYPFFGYSLFLYACNKMALATGFNFPFLIKLFQVMMVVRIACSKWQEAGSNLVSKSLLSGGSPLLW